MSGLWQRHLLHSGPGAFIVGPCRQAEWWHGAVAVESLGGECEGLGLRPRQEVLCQLMAEALVAFGAGCIYRWAVSSS